MRRVWPPHDGSYVLSSWLCLGAGECSTGGPGACYVHVPALTVLSHALSRPDLTALSHTTPPNRQGHCCPGPRGELQADRPCGGHGPQDQRGQAVCPVCCPGQGRGCCQGPAHTLTGLLVCWSVCRSVSLSVCRSVSLCHRPSGSVGLPVCGCASRGLFRRTLACGSGLLVCRTVGPQPRVWLRLVSAGVWRC